MNIKNYTTQVPAIKSISNIESLLMSFGASNIMKEIVNGSVRSISFRILIENTPFAFKLPGNTEPIYVWLKKKRPQSKNVLLLAQAERIAWKHQYEWLHIQLTGIELAQLDKIQALLPYSFDPSTNTTFYERLKEGKFAKMISNG